MQAVKQRLGRSVGLLAVAVLLLGSAACGKGRRQVSAGKPDDPPAPGAANDGPVVARVPYRDLEYAADGTFELDGTKFTGIAVEYHEDGETLAKLYEMRDGQFHGSTREYYANGQPSATTQWEHGKRHGPNIYWNAEGKETKRQRYEHDIPVETVELDAGEEPEQP